MMNKAHQDRFNNAIIKALEDFKQRLEQQRSFQIQTKLLKKLQEKVKNTKYCYSLEIEKLSLGYEELYKKSKESGKTYENIIEEKNLVDTYSAFENFLFDCFYSLYYFFPKYLGHQVSVSIYDLFIEENVALCKKNIIELEIKGFIQANNIIEIIKGFDKKFNIKEIKSIPILRFFQFTHVKIPNPIAKLQIGIYSNLNFIVKR